MKKILITTTDSLFGWEIEAYLKPVFASVVIGSNAIADIGASFTDFFGGRSGNYEKRLQLLKDNAITILTTKASELGANCILALKIDLDEISGKGTQMFMITACGTAVIARNSKNQTYTRDHREVGKDIIDDRANTIQLSKKFQTPDALISIDELKMIVDSRSVDFKNFVIGKLKGIGGSKLQEDELQKFIELYKQYFSEIDRTHSIPSLYEALLQERDENLIKIVVSIIKENDLLDFGYVQKLLDSDILRKKTALNLLLAHKPGYNSDDVILLEEIIKKIETSFPKVATISTKKGFLSSTEKEIWTCACGNTNSISNSVCSNCSKDQYGFTLDELKPGYYVNELLNRLEALKEAFS